MSVAPERPPEQHAQRPDLHVVPDVPDLTPDGELGTQAEPTDGDVEPQAPWQYRVHAAVTSGVHKLPTLWTERPVSFAERVEYSRSGDWAVAESGAKRTLHLLGTILCLPVGAVGAFLLSASEKPSRFFLLVTALLIVSQLL